MDKLGPGIGSDVIQSESKGLDLGADVSLRGREDDMRCPHSHRGAEERDGFSLAPPFTPFRPSTDWGIPTHAGKGSLLY